MRERSKHLWHKANHKVNMVAALTSAVKPFRLESRLEGEGLEGVTAGGKGLEGASVLEARGNAEAYEVPRSQGQGAPCTAVEASGTVPRNPLPEKREAKTPTDAMSDGEVEA